MAVEGLLAAEIVDLTNDGRGVADVDGQRLFVTGALPAERVLIAPRGRRRRRLEADLVRVVEPTKSRVEARCEYFGRCGGCALQHMAYHAQLRFKQGVVEQAFERIARAAPEQWLEPVASREWGYRRRARLGVRFVEGKQRVLVGFRERAARFVTDMSHCAVLAAPMDGLIGELADAIGRSSLRRRLPQVELAVGDDRSAVVLRILDAPARADAELFAEFGERHGVDMYFQSGGPGTVAPVGPRTEALSYSLPEFGVAITFAPTDFVQVNAEVNARMVAAAVEAAEAGPGDRVLDLYCGLGNFSLPFARRSRAVLGIDGESGLIARAVGNAASNGISNTRFLAADLSRPEWRFFDEPWDVVLLDPPRTGAEAAVSRMKSMTPRRIVYVSCHPATLARDTKILLEDRAYRFLAARVFDMFPHTHHVEVMALFERRG